MADIGSQGRRRVLVLCRTFLSCLESIADLGLGLLIELLSVLIQVLLYAVYQPEE
jgi:hypothetical protein